MARAGFLFIVLTAGVVLFQLALALGAPWGHLAMGGQWPGTFPPALRAAALAQAGVLAGMAWVVAGHVGLIAARLPRWTLWAVLAVTLLSTVLNLTTPSLPERYLWGPVTLVMLACVIRVVRS